MNKVISIVLCLIILPLTFWILIIADNMIDHRNGFISVLGGVLVHLIVIVDYLAIILIKTLYKANDKK